MKFLGWLKGRGKWMAGLIGACLLPLAGCPQSTVQEQQDIQHVEDTLSDVYEEPEVFPVYGVWEDARGEDLPPLVDVYGIWPDDVPDVKLDASVYGIWDAPPEVCDVYGIWDAGEPEVSEVYGIWPEEVKAETKDEPEVMDMYGVWEPDAKPDTEDDAGFNPEVYGIWPEDVKE